MDPNNDGENLVETVDAEATVLTEGGEPTAVIVQLPDDESGDDDDGSESAPVSDAVAIAGIEAEAAVTIAAIETDGQVALIEAQAELAAEINATNNERENEWLREREALTERIAELEAAQAAPSLEEADLSTPMTPLEPENQEPEPEAETGNNSTQQFTSDPTPSTVTEVILDVADASAALVPGAAPRRKRRLI